MIHLDPVVAAVVVVAVAAAAAFTLVLAALARAKPRRNVEAQNPVDPVAEALERIGLERALAREFLSELRRAVREGRVRVALYSHDCPGGSVVYDFARRGWLCVSRDGTAAPLGGVAAGEEVVEEEEV